MFCIHRRLSVSCNRSNYIAKNDSIGVNVYCADAVPGDVNGDGTVLGGDITYASNYFRGGPPPPDSCMCSDEFLYHAADANGDCNFIGSDITFLIRYFGGGPEPRFCPDCPTGGLLLSNEHIIPTEKAKITLKGK